MHKTLVILAVLLLDLSALGQGTILFNNRVVLPGGVDAPVSRCDGSGAGAGATAQLFLVSGSGASTAYMPLEPATTFRTFSPITEYYVVQPPNLVVVPGIRPGEPATVVLRAWEGSSYETASVRGQSLPITISLGPSIPIGPIPDTLLIGLQGFSMCIPEPSTLAVLALGLGVLFSRRSS